jgi:aspartyl protease family protein
MAALSAALTTGAATAADLALSGVLGGKAILVVDNGPPRVVAVGKSSPEGVKVLAVEGNAATVEFYGRRHRLRLGERVVRQGAPTQPGANMSSEQARKILARGLEIAIEADPSGHFMVDGEINGVAVRFMVDTGATYVGLGRSQAARIGIDLSDGEEVASVTAGGKVRAWRVNLRTLKVGGVRFDNVTGDVTDAEMPFALLGMSVLDKMEMRRDGKTMYLKRKL